MPSLLTTAHEKAHTVIRGNRPRVKKYKKTVTNMEDIQQFEVECS